MKKLMGAYCERQGVSPDSIRFLFNGERIQPEQDPTVVCSPFPSSLCSEFIVYLFILLLLLLFTQLDMEDNDVIDAVLAQSKSNFTMVLFIFFFINPCCTCSWWMLNECGTIRYSRSRCKKIKKIINREKYTETEKTRNDE